MEFFHPTIHNKHACGSDQPFGPFLGRDALEMGQSSPRNVIEGGSRIRNGFPTCSPREEVLRPGSTNSPTFPVERTACPPGEPLNDPTVPPRRARRQTPPCPATGGRANFVPCSSESTRSTHHAAIIQCDHTQAVPGACRTQDFGH